jgi:hypothetical protein
MLLALVPELRTRRRTLQFDFVLHDQCLLLAVDGLGELGGDGMVSCLVLDYKALVANHAAKNCGLLDGPVADIRPLFGGF